MTARSLRKPQRLTSAEILDAIRRWNELYGEPPTMADWDPYRARSLGQQWRVARYDSAHWPSMKTVRNHFGRLSDAVAAAGLVPRLHGQQRVQPHLVLADATLLHLSYLQTMQRSAAPAEGLAAAIRRVAAARSSREPGDLRTSLMELAAARGVVVVPPRG